MVGRVARGIRRQRSGRARSLSAARGRAAVRSRQGISWRSTISAFTPTSAVACPPDLRKRSRQRRDGCREQARRIAERQRISGVTQRRSFVARRGEQWRSKSRRTMPKGEEWPRRRRGRTLVQTKKDKSGEAVTTRPMCKYPAWPRDKGDGRRQRRIKLRVLNGTTVDGPLPSSEGRLVSALAL